MIYKTSKGRLILARQRRLNRKPKGSDLDYINCITQEYKECKTRRAVYEKKMDRGIFIEIYKTKEYN